MPGMNSCSPRCSASEITGTTAPPGLEPIAGAIGRGAENGRTTGLLSKHGSRMSWSGPGSAGGVTLVDVPAQAAGHDLPSNPAPMIPAPPVLQQLSSRGAIFRTHVVSLGCWVERRDA